MTEINSGLEGVVVAETSISLVDGKQGKLVYCGYNIEEIAKRCCFEDVVFLLWNKKFPTEAESKSFKIQLANKRSIPSYLKDVLKKIPKNLGTMATLRTAISAFKCEGESWPPTIEQGIEIVAKIPTIITYFFNANRGHKEIEPDPALSHTENYLYMLHGKKPNSALVKALDCYLILTADHGMNASTFTARVVTSTQSDIVSAITAAIGALKGPLHGGAPSEVDDMLEEIKTEKNAESWIKNKLEKGDHIMGFGHRVYKTYDPRAAILKSIVQKLPSENSQLSLSLSVEKVATKLLNEYKPGRNLYTNVEFWAAAILRTIQLPRELYTPTFCAGRAPGWIAHILEQAAHNRLIRPSAIYTGFLPKIEAMEDAWKKKTTEPT